MPAQEIVDELEAAAFARYLAMRKAFGPCWGRKPARVPAATRDRRDRRGRFPEPDSAPG